MNLNKKSNPLCTPVLLALLVFSFPHEGWAKTQKKTPSKADQKLTEAIKKSKISKKRRSGWFKKLKLGANLSLAHAANVPGLDEGLALSVGIVINGSLKYLNRSHSWNTSLTAVHTQTKTPTIEPFIKTADNLDIKSFYSYGFRSKYRIGFFAGLQLTTSIFPTNLVVAKETSVVNVQADGSKDTPRKLAPNISENLTGPFAPLQLKGKAGFKSRPFEDKFAKLDLKFSLVQSVVLASGRTVQDDASTPELELRILQNYNQLGAELNVSIGGDVNKRIRYAFSADMMLPFFTNIPTKLSGFQLLNADIAFKVGVKLAKWASLDYVFRAQRMPLLSERWQVSNNLVLSVTADFL